MLATRTVGAYFLVWSPACKDHYIERFKYDKQFEDTAIRKKRTFYFDTFSSVIVHTAT